MLDLWLQPVDEASIRWAEAHASVLDDEETQRWRRYRSDEGRALFLVAHVATRHVLSRAGLTGAVDRPPESWIFDRGANGRPEIVNAPVIGGQRLRFNISHTGGMVAVLVHGEADCGVDVEQVQRPVNMRSVARRVFTESEQADLFAQPADRQADCFYQRWTLKEAFIKAKGKGFALPLSQFSFALDPTATASDSGEGIAFDCEPTIDSAPSDWRFATHRTGSRHIVSIAAQVGAGDGDLPLAIRELDIS